MFKMIIIIEPNDAGRDVQLLLDCKALEISSFSMTRQFRGEDGGRPACPLMQFDEKRVKK